MNENIIMIDPLILTILMKRKAITDIIKSVIKDAIKEAEANHRVYKLNELLAEHDDDEN